MDFQCNQNNKDKRLTNQSQSDFVTANEQIKSKLLQLM